jgi:hypothetical protein
LLESEIDVKVSIERNASFDIKNSDFKESCSIAISEKLPKNM